MATTWQLKSNAVWDDHNPQTWKPLDFLNLYRLGLAGAFFIVALVLVQAPPFGQHSPVLFILVSTSYLIFSLVTVVNIRKRWPSYQIQAYAHLIVDLFAIILLMHSSGGNGSGLGMLLIMPVASWSILTNNRTPAIFPATATLAILFEQVYSQYEGLGSGSFTHAALLGISLFATSIVTQVLVARIKSSEALATQRGIDLANLAQLNEQIVQHMRSGVVVIDMQEKIHLINQAAWYLLGKPTLGYKPGLSSVSPDISRLLARWQIDTDLLLEPFCAKASYPMVLPRFIQLGKQKDSGTVIFLEDSSEISLQAQQMKLASLGRLTASIAHEIRNPLAAISHAGQLLAESKCLADTDIRLTEIIGQHCERVNSIIENILQLSRKVRSYPVETNMLNWLEQFREEFCINQQIGKDEIAIEVTPTEQLINVDPGQLHQVVWNLSQNGLRHSKNFPKQPKLILRGGYSADLAGPFLDILDHGNGIATDVAEHIFEPFYTTDSAGTGLGLYIARELCECNRASLEYLPVPDGGSCFRICFSNPHRQVA